MSRLFDRAVIRLAPEDPSEDVPAFLQGLVTNDTKGALPVWAALLSPQGKALFDFLIWADGDAVLLDCEASAADALAKRLTLYRLRRKIRIARADDLAVHWSLNDKGLPDPRLAALGNRWIAPASAVAVLAIYFLARLVHWHGMPDIHRAMPGPTRLRVRNRRFEPESGFDSFFA